MDVNIRRVLARVFRNGAISRLPGAEAEIHRIASRILPRDAYTWNQALMDLGATICTARKPACHRCPLGRHCRSSHLGMATEAETRIQARREPSHAGVPNRLWRGRIVEALRSLDDHNAVTVPRLGKSIKEDFRQEETRWLLRILQSLSDDGIVTTGLARGITVVRLADE